MNASMQHHPTIPYLTHFDELQSAATSPYIDTSWHEALRLHDMGLNVFPQPYGKKAGFLWKEVRFNRLHQRDLVEVFAGHCNLAVMTGQTSRNLFVIDCESAASFQFHTEQMMRRGIPIWRTATHRGGHLWMFCHEGEVANVEPGILLEAEIRANGRYVLAPPSLHPDGTQYRFLHLETPEPPTVHLAQIDWLIDRSGSLVQLSLTKRPSIGKYTWEPFDPLAESTRDYIDGRIEDFGYPQDQLYAAACECHANDIPQAQATELLTPTAVQSGLSSAEIQRNIRNAYSQQRTPARTRNPKARRVLDWQSAQAFALKYRWVGKAGTTNRHVFNALIERAKVANENGTFRATERELGEMTHKERKTMRTALRRMKNSSPPLILYAGSDATSGGNLFRFSDYVLKAGRKYLRESSESTPLPLNPMDGFNGVKSSPLEDILEAKALGSDGYYLYTFLLNAGKNLTCPQLAAQTHLSVEVVRRLMRKFKRLGLAVHISNHKGYVVVSKINEELLEIISLSGTEGKSEKRRTQHQSERARYAARVILRYRQVHDSGNLPEYLRCAFRWECPACQHHEFCQPEDRPRDCHGCGCANVRWVRVGGRKRK